MDTVKVLANIDKKKAEVVLKTTIEKSLQLMDIYTPIVSKLHFSIPDDDAYLSQLKELDAQISDQITQTTSEKTYEQILDYIDLVSKITDEPAQTSKRLLASILAERVKTGTEAHLSREPIQPVVNLERGEKQYYKPSEVAKKLGLSDQTIRRMCENGKFQEAFQTDGGHWRIPEDDFVTTKNQDRKAEQVLEHIDRKNNEVGGCR